MIISFSIFAQVQYSDVTPDEEMLDDINIKLDLDGDGFTDCSLLYRYNYIYFTSQYEYIILTENTVEIATVNDSASALHVNEFIDQDLQWSNIDTTYLLYDLKGYYHYGEWYNIKDHGFLGLRIKNEGNYYYAWIRINVKIREGWNSHIMYVPDFAINTIPNEKVKAGQGLPSFATSVYGFDGNDYLDARDVSVSFTKAYYDSLFSEYRIILAKADDSTAYDLDSMNQVQENRYTKVLLNPDDSNHTVSLAFAQDILDKDGDSIERYLEYKVHLLNVSETGDASNNLLSVPSPSFFLNSVSKAVGAPTAYDVDNTGTSGDIKVEFDKVDREDFIMEYRIFISHYEDTLSLDIAMGFGSDYYTSIIPDGNNAQLILNTGQSDINGNTITEDVGYVVYVLSVADSVYSKTSALSYPSKRFRLADPDILRAGQTEGNNLIYVEIDTILHIKYGDTEHIDTLSIDIDKDGTRDIKFIGNYDGSPSGWEYIYLHAVGLGNTKIMLCDHINHSNWTALLYENYQIGEQFIFSNENTVLHEHVSGSWDNTDYYIGHFRPFHDSYVGICLMDYSQPVYGWIRITKVSGGYLFKGYAYEIDASSIEDMNLNNLVMIYPNPAHDFIYLETLSSNSPGDDIQVKVFDVQGHVIDEFSFKGSSHKLNISSYPTGIYFCALKFKNQMSETLKFIVR